MNIYINDGTFMVEVPPSTKQQKIQVQFKTHKLNYDITDYNVFPFQYGAGEYKVSLCEQINQTKYKIIETKTITADLPFPYAPFLLSNQYVNFKNLQLPRINAAMIPTFMSGQYMYDYIKAYKSVKKTNILPDINYVVKTHQGICYDLAAFAAATCRYNGIPAKLVIGHADGAYHAWIEYLSNNKWIIYDPTAAILRKKIKRYKTERFY